MGSKSGSGSESESKAESKPESELVTQWRDRLARVPGSILDDDLSATTLAERYETTERGTIDTLTHTAGQRARPDDRVSQSHFDAAARELGVAIVDDSGAAEPVGDDDPELQPDGGHSADERIAELEAQVTNLEARLEHVDGKVNRVLAAARQFGDALVGAGGDQDE